MKPNPLRKIIQLCLIIFLPSLFLTGCWDRLEIEDRAVVLAIAVDKIGLEAEKEEKEIAHMGRPKHGEENQMYRLTTQIAVPGRIPLGPSQGGGGGGGPNKPVWVLSSVGHTIDDAIVNLQQQISNQLFFGHLRVIVIGEDLAKSGIDNLNDYLRRSSEVRRAAWMVVAKGEAKEVLQLNPELERVPALYLLSTLEGAVRMGKLPNGFVGVFWSASSSKGQEPYLPYIEVMPQKNIMISGLALFKGRHMVGVTKPIQIGYFMAMKSINPGGYTALSPVPGKKEDTVTIKATDRRSKIEVEMKNGKPIAHVKTHIEVNIIEKNNENFQVKGPEMIKKLEKSIDSKLGQSFLDFIKETQEKGSDIFGFGEYVRAKLPKYWNSEVKTKEKWDEIYKELPVDVNVQINIRRVGMKAS